MLGLQEDTVANDSDFHTQPPKLLISQGSLNPKHANPRMIILDVLMAGWHDDAVVQAHTPGE